ncbi:DNA methyltransferase [Ruminococcus sp. Marseille-P6503]|uniref:DNA methyltransferase n=1 Tax=Ruminococcus sp. Marseille-P6503 TaxID=2364796 RepID=UPI000F520B72|nr:DNA methyltransferase [Ruminococcus sp. Marseille-P6503]
MDKSYILTQYLSKLRLAMQKAGYDSLETRNFLLMTLFSVFCENTGLFLGKPFSALIFNSDVHELGTDLSSFFSSLPPEMRFPFAPEKVCSDIQNKLISFVTQDWNEVSPAELGKLFLSDGTERKGVFYTSDSDIDRILDNMLPSAPDERILKDAVFLDPASGCGNFLIRTAKKLSEFELSCGILHGCSWIDKNRFCGIEIDEEAVQVSKAALFIQLRLCRISFARRIGRLEPLDSEFPKNIVCADSLKTDWTYFKPDFIIGNPPFISLMNSEQRKEVMRISGTADRIDYSGAWIIKAAQYIKALPEAKCGFLTTSSVCQGIQVKPIWQRICQHIKLDFAYSPFKLESNSVQVWCVILGFSSRNTDSDNCRLLYTAPDSLPVHCRNINAYLHSDPDMFLMPSYSQRSGYPEIKQGRYEPQSIFSRRSLKNKAAQCKNIHSSLYITADSLLKSEALYVIEQEKLIPESYIVIPRHSSESRKYIPIAYFSEKPVRFNSSVDYIAGADLFLFGVLCSSMHMAFTKYFCGRLEMRYRYSASLIYNNFFIPQPDEKQERLISEASKELLRIRKKYRSIMALGEMYTNMPAELDTAHRRLDCLIDRLYGSGKLFLSDSQRVQFLYDQIL